MAETAFIAEFGSLANHGDNREESAQWALQILKQIEQSGGPAAFENWLKEINNGADAHILPDSETGFEFNTQAGLLPSSAGACRPIYTILKLRASVNGSNYFGSGGAFGLGVGYLSFDADMVLHDERTFDSLRGSVSRFWFFAGTSMDGQPRGTIKFYDKDGNALATALVVIDFGIPAAVRFNGDFELKK
ncbi:hypothetical protein FRC12_023806 [Ceratobasidium sp. 428]|nr:hypothetical protein FRC12_023806 [Ceratobasidium sp. 428]